MVPNYCFLLPYTYPPPKFVRIRPKPYSSCFGSMLWLGLVVMLSSTGVSTVWVHLSWKLFLLVLFRPRLLGNVSRIKLDI